MAKVRIDTRLFLAPSFWKCPDTSVSGHFCFNPNGAVVGAAVHASLLMGRQRVCLASSSGTILSVVRKIQPGENQYNDLRSSMGNNPVCGDWFPQATSAPISSYSSLNRVRALAAPATKQSAVASLIGSFHWSDSIRRVPIGSWGEVPICVAPCSRPNASAVARPNGWRCESSIFCQPSAQTPKAAWGRLCRRRPFPMWCSWSADSGRIPPRHLRQCCPLLDIIKRVGSGTPAAMLRSGHAADRGRWSASTRCST
jgi:hypothetical protein